MYAILSFCSIITLPLLLSLLLLLIPLLIRFALQYMVQITFLIPLSSSSSSISFSSSSCCHKVVQNIIESEMNAFQSRLGRCSMDCQDKAKDKFDLAKDLPKAEQFMLGCMSTCVETHISLLRSVQSKLEKDIDSVVKQQQQKQK
jgi:hypothetical protein